MSILILDSLLATGSVASRLYCGNDTFEASTRMLDIVLEASILAADVL